MIISRRYTFEAMHHLPNVPDSHKCKNPHGHSYKVWVHVSGTPDEKTGMVMDFADIDEAVRPLIKKLCHSNLNDTIPNPTSENLCVWLLKRMVFAAGVEVWETENSKCSVWK